MIEATWRLPAGHEAVSCFVTKDEAVADARLRIADAVWAYYLTDKRGSWEVVRYRKA